MQLEIRDRVTDNDTLQIEANQEIIPRFRGSFHRNIHPSDKTAKEVGELGSRILEQFFLTDGVTKVTIHSPYGFIVEKGLAFSWKRVRADLRGALRYCLKEKAPEPVRALAKRPSSKAV